MLGILLIGILSLSIYSPLQWYTQHDFHLAQEIPSFANEKTEKENNVANESLEEPGFLLITQLHKITILKIKANQAHSGSYFSIPPIAIDIHLPPPKQYVNMA